MPDTLPDVLTASLEPHLGGAVVRCTPVGGGCIAHASRLETEGETLFLKWGGDDVRATFPAEAAGLRALRDAGSPLHVPSVRAVDEGDEDRPGFLLAEWVGGGARSASFWDDFGAGLAALHRQAADDFGFDRDNFIGRLPQQNGWMERWPAFFRDRRLAPQVRMARDRGRWQRGWDAPYDVLVDRLDDLLPAAPAASVLHGDLWGGNFMVADDGTPTLIDPAAYYGHREADLAMTELFGGFEVRFYDAYRGAWALEPGYDERREVYNLYHLVNHLNHFGGSYAGQVERILRRFG